jgi:hypothetical protein
MGTTTSYHLASTVNPVVNVTSGQFAHDNHGYNSR